MGSRARRVAVALVTVATLGLLAGCTRRATQLIAVIDSDIPASDYACVGITVSRVDGTVITPGDRRMYEVPELVEVPFSLGITPPDGDPGRRVQLTAEAWPTCSEPALGATPIVSRTLRTGFLPEQALRVALFLANACRGVICPGTQSCSPMTGACEDIRDIPPEELTPIRPGDELRPDGGAGADAGPRRDAGPRDGGPSGPTVDMLRSEWLLEGLEIPSDSDPRTRVTSMCGTPTGVALAGFTSRGADFGSSLATSTPISSGAAGIWVAQVALDGSIDWLRTIPGSAAIDRIDLVDDLLVITGAFQTTVSFSPGSVTAVDSVDAFAVALELSTGATRWAASLGTNGSDDFGAGAAATDAGVLVSAWTTMPGSIHFGGTAPPALEGDASGQAVLAVLDATSGSLVRAIGLGGNVDAFSIHSDGAHGALVGLASFERITGLHAPVAGGGGHELAISRFDASASWAWTTYLQGCAGTTSLRVTRNAGAVWTALTDSGCSTLTVTLATPAGSRAGAPIVPGVTGPLLWSLGLDELDGTPIDASARAIALGTGGGRVSALTVDGAESRYVGGWLALPAGGAMLDFGGGPRLFTRNTSGTVQSNGAAFLWSSGADGAFRGVDSWNAGGAGSIINQSDMVTGIAVDATGLSIAGWLHGLGTITGASIGGGTGYDVAFLVHTR